jgi:hypothetical protein
MRAIKPGKVYRMYSEKKIQEVTMMIREREPVAYLTLPRMHFVSESAPMMIESAVTRGGFED